MKKGLLKGIIHMFGINFPFKIPALIILACLGLISNASSFAHPINDDFANRIFLTGYSNAFTISTVGATAEPKEPNSNFTGLRPSIWYSWTAPEDGTAFVYYSGDNYVRYFGVFAGASLTSLHQIGRTGTSVGFEVKAGQVFQIQAMAPTTTPDYDMHLVLYPRPSNDNFENRIQLESVVTSTNGDTTSATRERGEPQHNAVKFGRSVWYSWNAPATGWLFVEVSNGQHMICEPYTGNTIKHLRSADGILLNENPFSGVMPVDSGTEYNFAVDGTLYYGKVVYSGLFTLNLEFTGLTLFAPLNNSVLVDPLQINLMATNTLPDIDGDIDELTFYALNLLNQQETVLGTSSSPIFNQVWNNPINGYYQIQARGTNSEGRLIRSNPAIIAIKPANDDFDNRFTIEGNEAEWSLNFAAATRSKSDPKVTKYLDDDFDGSTLWWTWTAPEDGAVTLNCDKWTIALAVYTGHPGAFKVVMAPCWTSGQFQAHAGKTYQILLSDRYPNTVPSQGNVHLNLQP